MTERHAKRLLKLADRLEEVERREFDMCTWWTKKCDAKGNVCGTAGCALGWAGMMPGFRRLGLKTALLGDTAIEFSPTTVADRVVFDRCDNEDLMDGWEVFPVATNLNAARRFFGLMRFESRQLFTPSDGHHGPKQVARNIRKMVRKYHPKLVRAARKAGAA
jgi:hypothetical protein